MTSTATVDAACYMPPFETSAADKVQADDERYRAGRALTRLLGDIYPPPPHRKPSTFGLTAAELKAEGNRLARSGWPVAEVCQVLALPRPERITS